MGRGFNLFKVFGIQVSIDYSWFIVFGLVVWSLSALYFPNQYPGLGFGSYLLVAILSALLLFGSVLAHELSHSVVAKRAGIDVPQITLFIFGGVAQIAQEPESARIEFRVAVAGLLMSLFLAALFWIIARVGLAADWAAIVNGMFYYLALINVLLAIFNSVPGFPLDGGRILRAYLWQRWKNLLRATRAAARVGSGFGIFLILIGFLEFFRGNLIGGIWLVLIGMFLQQSARAGYEMAALRDALAGVKVRELMSSNVITVEEQLPVSQLVQDFVYRYRFVSFPVLRGDRLVGMVSINNVKEVPREQWETTTVGQIMVPVEQLDPIDPEADSVEALGLMVRKDVGRLPVTRDGRLVGILSRRDIMNLFRIRSDIGI